MDPLTPVKSAVRAHDKNYSTQISNQGAQADLKIFSTSKIKYSQIPHFLDNRVQNVPENSSKTSLLDGVSKQAKRSDRPSWKFRLFWIPRRTILAFFWSFLSHLCVLAVFIFFNLEMRNTGLVYHRHWGVSLLSHFWGFKSRSHIFAWTTWPETLSPRRIMRPRD